MESTVKPQVRKDLLHTFYGFFLCRNLPPDFGVLKPTDSPDEGVLDKDLLLPDFTGVLLGPQLALRLALQSTSFFLCHLIAGPLLIGPSIRNTFDSSVSSENWDIVLT